MSNRQPRRPAASTAYPAHPVTAASSPARPAARPGTKAPTHLRTKRRPTRQAPSASTGRPTATYPTADHLAHLDRLADLWADVTPTEELPVARTARFVRTKGEALRHPQPAPFVRTTGPQNEGPIQDMWRPRWLPAWHPSLMQLAIGAALVLVIIGACNVAAINAHREARAYCHALVVSDRARAQRECRGTGAGTPVPEQVPSAPSQPAPAAPSQDASAQPEQAAPTAPATPSPTAGRPDWVTQDTGAPYSKDDPAASPLSLPRCTTSPDTPMPCLAHISNDSNHAVVLEEDASLTGLIRQ